MNDNDCEYEEPTITFNTSKSEKSFENCQLLYFCSFLYCKQFIVQRYSKSTFEPIVPYYLSNSLFSGRKCLGHHRTNMRVPRLWWMTNSAIIWITGVVYYSILFLEEPQNFSFNWWKITQNGSFLHIRSNCSSSFSYDSPVFGVWVINDDSSCA